MDSIAEPRHARNDGRLEDLHVITEASNITAEKADAAAGHEHGRDAAPFEHVCQRQERHVRVVFVRPVVAELVAHGRQVRHHVLVRQHGTLRIAGRATRVADDGQVARTRLQRLTRRLSAQLFHFFDRVHFEAEADRFRLVALGNLVDDNDVFQSDQLGRLRDDRL